MVKFVHRGVYVQSDQIWKPPMPRRLQERKALKSGIVAPLSNNSNLLFLNKRKAKKKKKCLYVISHRTLLSWETNNLHFIPPLSLAAAWPLWCDLILKKPSSTCSKMCLSVSNGRRDRLSLAATIDREKCSGGGGEWWRRKGKGRGCRWG